MRRPFLDTVRSTLRLACLGLRAAEWRSKAADAALVLSLSLLAQAGTTLDVALLRLLLVCAYLAAGYAWNTWCDRETDVRAGKLRSADSARHAGTLAVVMISIGGMAFYAAAPGTGELAIAMTCLFLAWSYSARPLRWKERGVAGVFVGGFAQRAGPVLLLCRMAGWPWALSVAWTAWATLFGVRGMLIHQALDAEADRRSDVRTFGARLAPARIEKMIILVALVEAAVFIATFSATARMLRASVLAPATAILWLLLTGATLLSRKVKREPVRWSTFEYVPFADLYGVVAPLVALAALAGAGPSFWPWVFVDVVVRGPQIRQAVAHVMYEGRPAAPAKPDLKIAEVER